LTLAGNAAQEIGNATHSFTTIQLPVNLLEREGLKCAAWAKQNGLRVLANRPLNAQYNGLMYRLCDYYESDSYYHHFNELLDVCDNEKMKTLYTLLEQLDENKHKFGWIGDYDSFLYAQILPHIKKSLALLDTQHQETVLHYLDLFLNEYRKMVAYECSKKTKLQLQEFFEGCEATMQMCAIKYLSSHKNIDYILVGMRKPLYVHEIVSMQY